MTFPCSGSISQISYYTSGKGPVRLGIARWLDRPYGKASVVYLIEYEATGREMVHNVSYGPDEYSIQKGDFIVIVGNESSISSIAYTKEEDDMKELQLALVMELDILVHNINMITLDVSHAKNFVRKRMEFSLMINVQYMGAPVIEGINSSHLNVKSQFESKN